MLRAARLRPAHLAAASSAAIGGYIYYKSNEHENTTSLLATSSSLPSRNTILPTRSDQISTLVKASEEKIQFDVLIVGGGATGAGAALDATTRGLNTALIERGDFGNETSSRST
jgi:glycerol-3-phosphate dehydrogenase